MAILKKAFSGLFSSIIPKRPGIRELNEKLKQKDNEIMKLRNRAADELAGDIEDDEYTEKHVADQLHSLLRIQEMAKDKAIKEAIQEQICRDITYFGVDEKHLSYDLLKGYCYRSEGEESENDLGDTFPWEPYCHLTKGCTPIL